MGSKEEFIKTFRIIAEDAASQSGCSVLSITFNSTKEGKILKIVIDGEDTNLEVCATISRLLSEWLDEHAREIPVVDYFLEVSSPGIDKPLKTLKDFEKLLGKLLYIETKTKAADGRKRYTGRLQKIVKETLFLYVEKESAEFAITLDNVSKARAEYDFREE